MNVVVTLSEEPSLTTPLHSATQCGSRSTQPSPSRNGSNPPTMPPNAWHGSTRRDRLPANWPTIRARILDRDPICRCQGCRNCTTTGCPANSTDADHIIPIDDHTDTNLQGLCRRCHLAKTGRDNARYNQARADLRRRPPERHPGARGGG